MWNVLTNGLLFLRTGLLVLGAIFSALYTLRTRKSEQFAQARVDRSIRELEQNARMAEVVIKNLEDDFMRGDNWIRQPLKAERSVGIPPEARDLYEKSDLLLDSLDVAGVVEKQPALKEKFAKAVVKSGELAMEFGPMQYGD